VKRVEAIVQKKNKGNNVRKAEATTREE